MTDAPQLIAVPDTLQRKARAGSGPALDAEALARAEAVLDSFSDAYLDWVADDLERLQEAWAAASGAAPEDRPAALDAVFEIAHDMKGQGGSFGYGLVTLVGDDLCRLIERVGHAATPAQLDVVRLHVEALRLVVAKAMTGDGGEAGASLLAGLRAAAAKVAPPSRQTNR